MFTGIVEETGIIKNIKQLPNGIELTISGNKIFDDLKIGDSVAIDGVCQTVTKINSDNTFSVETMSETLNLTNFKFFKVGQKVNLERALTLNSRLGGHIVSGHIEGLGKINNIKQNGIAKIFEITAPDELMKYIVYKGSITLNGVSLTVCDVSHNAFCISVIPHTIENTNLIELNVGGVINIETDVLAKYVEKLLYNKEDKEKENPITMDFLKENGF